MTYSNNEKNIAIAISLSIAFAFAGTTNVNADTVFPPAHTTGVFTESYEPNTTEVAGPYYRQGPIENAEVRFDSGRYEVAISGSGIAPYYRAAN